MAINVLLIIKQSFNIHWELLLQSEVGNINELFGQDKVDYVNITTGYQDIDTLIEVLAIFCSYGLW